MTTVKIGLALPQRGLTFEVFSEPSELIRVAVRAEEGGLDSVWVGDSLTAKPRIDAITLLGALAGATDRVRLGVGCMASFPIRDPLVFAYQWATLDLLSGGRAQLAACTGLVKERGASAAEGRHWDVTDKQRASRLEENIDICRLLWRGEPVSFEGRYHRFENLTMYPTPVQQPCPIWIAANPFPGPFQERAMRRVATMADGWMTVEFFPGALAQSRAVLQRHLNEAGRDLGEFPVFAYHNIHVGPSRAAALAETSRFLEAYYGPIFPPQTVEAWTAAGTVDECTEHIHRLVDAGATEISLRITGWDQPGQLDLIINELLPRLKEPRQLAS